MWGRYSSTTPHSTPKQSETSSSTPTKAGGGGIEDADNSLNRFGASRTQALDPIEAPEEVGPSPRQFVSQLAEQHRAMIAEVKDHRSCLLDEMKLQRQSVVDLTIEMKQGMYGLKHEISKLAQAVRESAARPANLEAKLNLNELFDSVGALVRKISTVVPAQSATAQLPASAPPAATAAAPQPPPAWSLTPAEGAATAVGTTWTGSSQVGSVEPISSAAVEDTELTTPTQVSSVLQTVLKTPPGSQPPSGVATGSSDSHKTPETSQTPEVQLSLDSAMLATPPLQLNAAPTAPVLSSLEKFKPKTGTWECSGCLTHNEQAVTECPACQTAKPDHETKPKTTSASGPAASLKIKSSGTHASKFQFNFSKPAATTLTGFQFGGSSTKLPAKQPAEDGHLSFNGLGLKLDTKEDAKPVAEKIINTTNIKDLTLSGNTIGIVAAEAIGKAIGNHSELERAYWKDIFTGRMKKEIPPALMHLSRGIILAQAKLVELDLSDNAFGPIGMEGVKDLLKSPSCYTLQELKLNNTGCGIKGGKLLATILLECYNESKKVGTPLALKVFVLGRSRLENEGATALGQVFKAMGSLEEVIMPQNGITSDGIATLADAFAANPNLRVLNLNDNTFTKSGARYLAKALPKLQHLEILNLGDCLLKTKGAIQIGNALKNGHRSLQYLLLDSNEIKLHGGEAIVKAMADKDRMKQLDISNNEFGEKGCVKLLNLLSAMKKRDLIGEEIKSDQGQHSGSEEESGESKQSSDAEQSSDTKPAKPSFAFPAQATAAKTVTGSKVPGSMFSFQGEADTSPAVGISTSSIFGSSSKVLTATPPIFEGHNLGGTSKEKEKFLFQKGPDTLPVVQSSSVFGGSSKAQNSIPSFFGEKSTLTSSSTFGGALKEEEKKSCSSEKPSFQVCSGMMSSFASLAASTGEISLGQKNNNFKFAGQGSSVFGTKSTTPRKEDADEGKPNDTEKDHDPQFEPIIPLPELVEVHTGEEDEEIVFQHRAKVYRFDPDTKEWKERGVGDLKILKHKELHKFRLLLRREQVFKIALNHCIIPEMELKPMVGSENAICWFATDYAESEEKVEHLAARFKLQAMKDEFVKSFKKCQESLREPPPYFIKKNKDLKPEIINPPSVTEYPKPEVLVLPDKNENTEKVKAKRYSLVSNPMTKTTMSSGNDRSFTFGSTTTRPNPFMLARQASVPSDPQSSGEEEQSEDGEHDPKFEPVIPMPQLVTLKTGEEEEVVWFQHRSKVYRFDSGEWKERGVGDLKILMHPNRNTYRILLRRDQVFKIALNHYITIEMKLTPKPDHENCVCWFAMDHADDNTGKVEHFAARFKLPEIKNEFVERFNEAKAQLLG